MFTIKTITASEIFDSRGNPTIHVVCILDNGVQGEASVPSGKSTGIHEALELRDGDRDKHDGLGVSHAIANVNVEINNFLRNKDWVQESLDQALIMLDGTENKSRLGSNSILGVSLAFARACAQTQGLELYQYLGNIIGNKNYTLPTPMLNVINGGKHADSGLDIQEFMIIPIGDIFFSKKIEIAEKIISQIRIILEEKQYTITYGDEGGFACKLISNEEALDILARAILDSGYTTNEIKIGIDAAASSFYKGEAYLLKDGKKNSAEMITWYNDLLKKYPIISIEDGLSEDDWDGFASMAKEFGSSVKIIGDDLTATNLERINMAAVKKAINSVLIKLNQIGTLSETIKAVQATKSNGWTPVISHRSGETMDTFIADLAVGLSCPYIKAGALSQLERVCKYNRLVEIETKLRNV